MKITVESSPRDNQVSLHIDHDPVPTDETRVYVSQHAILTYEQAERLAEQLLGAIPSKGRWPDEIELEQIR